MDMVFIIDELCAADVPATYLKWEDPPPPPYAVVFSPGQNPFYADGRLYFYADRAVIELYTEKKDPEAEAKVESVLARHSITYTKEEGEIPSEKMLAVVYQFEVI